VEIDRLAFCVLCQTDIADVIYTIFMTVYWWEDARPYHDACVVQQWRHHLWACVKASERSK